VSLKPSVSICIPAYNQTVYLNILLKSVERQTFTGYEIIVSDDSTKMDVKNLVDSFHFGEKLQYFRNEPSLGSPSNWNAAIQKASGEYIKIMHHDDAFTSDTALAEMMNFIETNGYDYIFADSKIENVKEPGKNRIHRIRKFSRLASKPYLLFFGNSIGSPSTSLIKRNPLAHLEYNPQYIWLVDMEYYVRLFLASSKGGSISKALILTHDAADHRLTSKIITDFDLQIKEQAMLYNYLVPNSPVISKFFMQVYLARLFFKARAKNKEITSTFIHVPKLLNTYFSAVKFKPLYFAYHIFIRSMDILRKILFY
jgi:glycosyltransferase involved in cell wall biosynthesis